MTDTSKEQEEEKLTQAEETPETAHEEAAVDVAEEKEDEEEKAAEVTAEPEANKERRRFQVPNLFSRIKRPHVNITHRRPTLDSFYCPEDRTQFRYVTAGPSLSFKAVDILAPRMTLTAPHWPSFAFT